MSELKKAGCCTWCDEEVFEVKTMFPEGPLHRFPRALGKPLPSAHRIDYVLTDGSTGSLTSCEKCVSIMTDAANFPEIWRKVIRTFMFEERDDVRAALPSAPRTQEQRDAVQADIVKLNNNPPIGVIAITKWSDHA